MSEKNTPKIGQKIKILREMKNYTQQYIAKELGISQRNYSGIEQGEVALTIDRLYELSEILGVSVSNILDFDQSKVFNVYNNTTEKGVISGNVVFSDSISENERSLYEKLLQSKDDEIKSLKERIEQKS